MRNIKGGFNIKWCCWYCRNDNSGNAKSSNWMVTPPGRMIVSILENGLIPTVLFLVLLFMDCIFS